MCRLCGEDSIEKDAERDILNRRADDPDVEDALKTALIEYLKTKQALLEKEFTKFFESKKGTSQLIAAMQDGFCKALTDKWHFTIYVAPPNR
ncbi:MAG: hypothetical protein BWX63_02254 [Bacteroidetes bacterium ADurb.Bin041]|nr:MAG: hypothetical protein BWX63_02254 [Bacteroidetes bacterium ADurb.Bin041]